MARLAYELRSMMPARQLRECRVDSIAFQPGRRAAEAVKHIKTLTHGQLQVLPKDHAFSKYTRTHSELPSDVPAFRVQAVKADDPVILRGCFQPPILKAEPPKPCVEWSYLTAEQATERILARQSCCLLYTSPSPRDATLSRMPSSA